MTHVKWLVLDMRSVNSVDASGVAMLERLLDNLAAKHVRVALAAMHAPIADVPAPERPATAVPQLYLGRAGDARY